MNNHIRKNHVRRYFIIKCKYFKFTFNQIKRVQNKQQKNHGQSSQTMENALKCNYCKNICLRNKRVEKETNIYGIVVNFMLNLQ